MKYCITFFFLFVVAVYGSAQTNVVADLGVVVVEGSAISKYRPATGRAATFTDAPVERIPVTVDTLSEDYIRDRNPADLDQLLATVPGVSQGGKTLLARNSGKYTLRGMSGSEVMLNGVVPVSAATGIYLDPNVLERVDIVKGPIGATLGGQTSTMGPYGAGGSVMLWQKRPVMDDSFVSLASRTSVGKNLYAQQFNGDVNDAIVDKKIFIRAPFSVQVSKPFWLDSNRDVGQIFTVAPSFLFRVSDDFRFGVDTMIQYGDTPGYQGIALWHGRPDGRYGYSWDTDAGAWTGHDVRDRYLSFSVMPWMEYDVTKAYTLRVGGGFAWSHITFDHFGPNSSGVRPAMRYEVSYMDQVNRQYSTYLHNIYTLETGPVKQTFLVAGDYVAKDAQGRSTFLGQNSLALIDRDSLVPTTTLVQRYGMMVQDQLTWGRLTALAGVRYDYHISANNRNGDSVSPRGGVSLNVFDWLIPFANVSESRSPNFGYYRDSNDPSTELTSEWRATQYEVGVRIAPVEKFWITASVFQIDQDNTPITVGTSVSEEGVAQSRGFELNGTGEITEDWSVFMGYTRLAYENRQTGVKIDRYPPNAISLYTTYRARFLFDSVWGFGYRYKDAWLETFRGEQTPAGYNVKSYSVFDGSVEVPLAKSAKMRLTVRNIFNKRYVESARNLQSFPGDPRTFELSVQFKF